MPANEGRGYVLRLILRRAARHGRMLGFTRPFLAEVAKTVIDTMGGQYDELVRRREFILTNIEQEESRFGTTLINGLALLDELIADLKSRGESVIPGADAFRLYDTHGFPLDLTQDVARDQGMTVDVEGYKVALSKQKEQSGGSEQFKGHGAETVQVYLDLLRDLKSEGVLTAAGVKHQPYDEFELETKLAAIVRDGQRVSSARWATRSRSCSPRRRSTWNPAGR